MNKEFMRQTKIQCVLLAVLLSACGSTSKKKATPDEFETGSVAETRDNQILSHSFFQVYFDVRKTDPNFEFRVTFMYPFTSSGLKVQKGQKLVLEIDGKEYEFVSKDGTEYIEGGGITRKEFVRYPGVKSWVLQKLAAAEDIRVRMVGKDNHVVRGEFSLSNRQRFQRFAELYAK